MNRWTSIIGALLLVLTIWMGGGAANAAVPFACTEMTAAAGTSEDQDQTPCCPRPCLAQHCSCNVYHIPAATSLPALMIAATESQIRFAGGEAGIPGHAPDRRLRPPIA